jgi:hypothetical protein
MPSYALYFNDRRSVYMLIETATGEIVDEFPEELRGLALQTCNEQNEG